MKDIYDFAAAIKSYTTFPSAYNRICAIDTETTGVNHRHGDRPFMASATFNDGESLLWEWDVDPTQRTPYIPSEDRHEIAGLLQHDDWLYVMQNGKFDVNFLLQVCEFDPFEFLCRCHDTLPMGHALNSFESHGLKDMACKHAGIPVSDETALKVAVNEAREIGRRLGWKIGNKLNCPHQKQQPKGGWWVVDMWLPRAVAKHQWEQSPCKKRFDFLYKLALRIWNSAHAHLPNIPEFSATTFLCKDGIGLAELKRTEGWEWRPNNFAKDDSGHPWWTVAAKYCSTDTLRTVVLFQLFERELKKQNLWEVYLENRCSLPISFMTESRGISINTTFAKTEADRIKIDVDNASYAINFARGPNKPVNPASSVQVRNVLYGKQEFGLPVTKWTKKGNPSTGKDVLADLLNSLRPEDPKLLAPPIRQKVESYRGFLKRLTYWSNSQLECEADRIFAFAAGLSMFKKSNAAVKSINSYLLSCLGIDSDGFAVLNPSLNSTGTKTVRYSSSNPNGQNISRGKAAFIEWLFRTNLSLRSIFGPRTGREWWSVDFKQLQLLIFAHLTGEQSMISAFERGEDFHDFIARKIFNVSLLDQPTKAQRTIAKNVNFGFIFGAQPSKIEETAHMSGLWDTLCTLFPNAIEFIERTSWDVRRFGYVTCAGGYRLAVPEEKPYAGVNYIVQGTEGEIVKRATIGVEHHLASILEPSLGLPDFYTTMYVHDELVFDSKAGFGCNLIQDVCKIMSQAGESFGIPTSVTAEHITTNWSEGKEIELDYSPYLVSC